MTSRASLAIGEKILRKKRKIQILLSIGKHVPPERFLLLRFGPAGDWAILVYNGCFIGFETTVRLKN